MVSNRASDAHKKVLIVEGGGADGLYAVGAIKYLIQQKHHTYSAMFGTSIGAAVTIGLACLQREHNSWDGAILDLEAKMSQLSKWSLIKRPALFGFFNGGYLISNVKNVVNKLFTKDHTFNYLKIHCEAFTTDYDADEPIKVLSGDYRLDDAVAMSVNIPGVFCFYTDPKDGHRCYDGGIAMNDPIAKAVEYTRNKGWTNVEYTVIRLGSYNPMKRSLFYTATKVILQAFSIARRQCEILSLKLGEQYSNDVHILHIPNDIGLLDFNKKTNMKYIHDGYEYAKQHYK